MRGQTLISRSTYRHISWQFTQHKRHLLVHVYIQIFSTVDLIVFPSGRRRTWWSVCYFFFVCKIQVLYTRWLRRQLHVPTSKSNSNNLIAGTTGIVRLWSIITTLLSARPCEPWKVKPVPNRCNKFFFFFFSILSVLSRSACLLTAGGQEQHQFYRSETHQQEAGAPSMMQQETCDKSSLSPTPTLASHNSLSSGLSPLGNHTSDPSNVTKEERSSRQRGQSSPSPSKSF